MTTAIGTFVTRRVRPLERSGQYRSRGSLRVTDNGLEVYGRHVYPLKTRWTWGCGIFFAVLIGTFGILMLGVIPIFLLIEYVILKREDITIPFDRLTAVTADQNRGIVAVDFEGPPNMTPLALRSAQWKALWESLCVRAPAVARSSYDKALAQAEAFEKRCKGESAMNSGSREPHIDHG